MPSEMSSQERKTWAYGGVAFVIPAIYCGYVIVQLRHTPVAEFAFQRPLLTAIGASIIVSMFATSGARGAATQDVRDRDINRHGEFVGFFVLAFSFLGAFVLTLLEAEYFWIANAIYAAYILNALTSSTAKILAYRRGL